MGTPRVLNNLSDSIDTDTRLPRDAPYIAYSRLDAPAYLRIRKPSAY